MSVNNSKMKPAFVKNQVEICKGDTCIRANGRNADRIATAAALMLLLVGIGALISASR